MAESNYLNETNPELLRATPRPGGRAKLLKGGVPKSLPPPPKVQDADKSASTKSKSKSKSKKRLGVKISDKGSTASLTGMHKGFGRMFNSAMRLSQMLIDKKEPKMSNMTKEYRIYRGLETTPWLQEMDEILDKSLKDEMPNPLQDSIDLLCISLSTVMLLAIGYGDIPREHLFWTLNYLKLITNDFDEYPPNVQGIINHIEKAHASLTSLSDLDSPQFHSTGVDDETKTEKAPEEAASPEEVIEEESAAEDAGAEDAAAEDAEATEEEGS